MTTVNGTACLPARCSRSHGQNRVGRAPTAEKPVIVTVSGAVRRTEDSGLGGRIGAVPGAESGRPPQSAAIILRGRTHVVSQPRCRHQAQPVGSCNTSSRAQRDLHAERSCHISHLPAADSLANDVAGDQKADLQRNRVSGCEVSTHCSAVQSQCCGGNAAGQEVEWAWGINAVELLQLSDERAALLLCTDPTPPAASHRFHLGVTACDRHTLCPISIAGVTLLSGSLVGSPSPQQLQRSTTSSTSGVAVHSHKAS
jgi:hypothetical protein